MPYVIPDFPLKRLCSDARQMIANYDEAKSKEKSTFSDYNSDVEEHGLEETRDIWRQSKLRDLVFDGVIYGVNKLEQAIQDLKTAFDGKYAPPSENEIDDVVFNVLNATNDSFSIENVVALSIREGYRAAIFNTIPPDNLPDEFKADFLRDPADLQKDDLTTAYRLGYLSIRHALYALELIRQ